MLERLAEAIRNNTTLNRFEIRKSNENESSWINKSAEILVPALTEHPRLNSLIVDSQNLSQETIIKYLNMLTDNFRITFLNFSFCYDNFAFLNKLSNIFKTNTCLKSIILNGIPADNLQSSRTTSLLLKDIPPEIENSFIPELLKGKMLDTLHLKGIYLTNSGIQDLANELVNQTNLTSLQLADCSFQWMELTALISSLSTHCEFLESLDLSFNLFHKDALKYLANQLLNLKNLKFLTCYTPTYRLASPMLLNEELIAALQNPECSIQSLTLSLPVSSITETTITLCKGIINNNQLKRLSLLLSLSN